jgi:hypothetical protein
VIGKPDYCLLCCASVKAQQVGGFLVRIGIKAVSNSLLNDSRLCGFKVGMNQHLLRLESGAQVFNPLQLGIALNTWFCRL